MRIPRMAIIGAPLLLGAAACEKDEKAPPALLADMSGAVSLALTKPAPQESALLSGGLQLAATSSTGGEPFFTLVKIDSDGNLDPVFNQLRPIHSVVVTETHVAVSGDFYDVSVFVGDDEDPEAIDCKLVTFPRTAVEERVKCLTDLGVGVFPFNDPSSPSPIDEPGMAARGTTLYFTERDGDHEAWETRLWKWDGGSDVIEALLQLSSPVALAQPHLTETGEVICVEDVESDPAAPSPTHGVYCSPITALDWQVAEEDEFALLHLHSLVVGTSLITGYTRVSLADGSVFPGRYDSLPKDREHTIVVGNTAYGIADAGIYSGDLVKVVPDGTVTSLDASAEWTRIVGGSNFAYVYGESDLRALDLATGVLGTANLLGATSLIQVTDMSLSVEPFVRLDGTDSGGFPVIVIVNTSSGEISVTSVDVPRFVNVTPLE